MKNFIKKYPIASLFGIVIVITAIIGIIIYFYRKYNPAISPQRQIYAQGGSISERAISSQKWSFEFIKNGYGSFSGNSAFISQQHVLPPSFQVGQTVVVHINLPNSNNTAVYTQKILEVVRQKTPMPYYRVIVDLAYGTAPINATGEILSQ